MYIYIYYYIVFYICFILSFCISISIEFKINYSIQIQMIYQIIFSIYILILLPINKYIYYLIQYSDFILDNSLYIYVVNSKSYFLLILQYIFALFFQSNYLYNY